MLDSEALLWSRWGDSRLGRTAREEARQLLLENYLPLVARVVGGMAVAFPSAVMDRDDLIHCGVLGLMSAFERFDPGRGLAFATYATPRIRGSVLDGLRALDWVPRSMRQAKAVVPPLLSLEDLRERRDAGEGGSLLESAPRQEAVQDALAELGQDRELIRRGLLRLRDKEQIVITHYYDRSLTLKQVATILGLTESRVCQIHAQALDKLRRFSHLTQLEDSRLLESAA